MVTGPAAIVTKHFENLTDPRVNRGKNHALTEMVFLALTATICGAQGWADVERFAKSKLKWFRRYVRLQYGVPSHDTFGRVFARLDTGEFLTAMHAWVDAFAGSLRGQGVAIDGKTLRGSFDRAAGKTSLHTITAFACDMRVCLRQMSVDEKSNEIPAVPELLKLMELSGATVTLDAMHCQVETARAIIAADADYILVVKKNQAGLYAHLLNHFLEYGEVDYEVEGLKRHKTVEKSHGRKERREYYFIAAPSDDQILARWPGIRSIGMVYRYRETSETIHEETIFVISSHAPKVKMLSRHVRGHWGIENRQHWVLDVTFSEDASRIRKGSSPEISAALRRMALNILQRDTTIKENIRGKRLRAGWDQTVLSAIYTGFSSN
ncbi:MAG: ISAs1 family transposase [Deltaproteobacteria bacterium]|nr:ISAs1 family transposase [Deltaproteobacteria bacterium]